MRSRASLSESLARPCYNEQAMHKNFFSTSYRSSLAGVLVSGALLLSGCGLTPTELKKIRPPSLPQPKVPQLKAGELPTITVIPAGTESYWLQAKLGAEAAGKKFGARIVWKVPTGDLIKSQKKLVENVSKTSQGLVLAPADSTKLMQPVGDAARAGVSVVAFDRDVFTVQNKMSFVHNDDAKSAAMNVTWQPDYYQMAFQSVQAIMNFRATKQMPPREIKIAPRVITKDPKPTNRSTP